MAPGPLIRRPTGARPFRVRVSDGEDLAVMSAYLQDAIVPLRETAFEPKDKRFTLIAQRFRWEKAPEPAPDLTSGLDEDGVAEDLSNAPGYERVHCALRFEKVTGVRSHGIDRADRGQMLSLLAVTASPGAVDLSFAENKTIRLEVTSLDAQAEDIGEPWPTVNRPNHDDEEAGADEVSTVSAPASKDQGPGTG